MIETQDAPGEVTVREDALQVVFHRHYARPIEKVWAAITTPERLADWLADAEVELKPGGRIHFNWNNGAHTMEGRVLVCEAPTAFSYTWTIDGRESVVRFDLKPDSAGCWLTLTHSGLSPRGAPSGGVRSGWHAHLEGLGDAIDGKKTPWAIKIERQNAVSSLYPPLPA